MPITACLRILAAAAAVALAGCAGTPDKPPSDRISFLDSRVFDDELSRALAAGLPEVTVETSAGVSLDRVPERMDKWLYAVREADHPVVAKPNKPLTRSIGLVALLQAIATGTYEWLRDSVIYHPARKYDATLLYDSATGRVEKIVFRAVEPVEGAPSVRP